MTTSGGAPQTLPVREGQVRTLAWVGNAQLVAEDTGAAMEGPERWRISVDGATPMQVTTDPSHKTQPAWSADGRRVAFTAWSYETTFWKTR